jgi:positive regulator of sigma E activity
MLKTLLSHDFRHTAINQLWKLFSGPLLLILVPLYLTAEAQGYWFTFISLAALAVFADMGFSNILLQFSAHEFAHLQFTEQKTLTGNQQHLERHASLLRFALKWSLSMALLVFPLVLLVGYVMLNEKDAAVDWQLPWIIYGVASVLVFINSMLLSFIEGCDSVGDVQKIRFHISVITVTSTLVLLISGAALYALAISLLVGAIAGLAMIGYRYRIMLLQLYRVSQQVTYAWKGEIMPLMWRYAISWVSGYFIFSIFTPIAFHYYGPVEAGQVGLSITICAAMFGIANIWMTIIVPKMNMFVSHGDYASLNPMFKRHLLLAVLTYLLGVLVLFLGVTVFKSYIPFVDRLVSVPSLALISFAWLVQVVINALAMYMRAHKEEPLVTVSFVSGVYIGMVTWLIALYLPVEYFFAGFLSAYIWGLPWVVFVFAKYRNKEKNRVS